jgi:farnesyl-diphosphate farnesyltransferase
VLSRRHRQILLGELLRGVSRSFYLTLRVLPPQIRDQIGTAYLLARATDTIADTDAVPLKERLAALERLRARISNESSAPLAFNELKAAQQSSPDEHRLLEKIENVLALLQSFDE